MSGISGSHLEARPVYTAHQGTNALLIAEVARLYLMPGLVIADVTYGRGVFWRQVDTSAYTFLPSDLAHGIDFRALPYADGSLDVLVLDPPYMHNPGRPQVNSRYRNAETTRGLSHAGIIQLYRDGLQEARRVVRPKGQVWVKCADEIESGRQRWSHIELLEAAQELGYRARDLFILQQATRTVQVKQQRHARKNHSYLWILDRH